MPSLLHSFVLTALALQAAVAAPVESSFDNSTAATSHLVARAFSDVEYANNRNVYSSTPLVDPPASNYQSYSSQPNTIGATKNGCAFVYVPQFGSDGKASKGTLGDPDTFTYANVRQSSIGDCGIGAAVLALIYNGQANLLTQAFVYNPTTKNTVFTLWQKYNTRVAASPRRVLVDDKLPQGYDNSGCPEYIGYLPCRSKDSSTCSTRRYFVPFLEKAIAKLADTVKPFKGPDSQGLMGYAGLQGTPSNRILSLFTRQMPRSFSRSQAVQGLDPNFKRKIQDCVSTKTACSLGTPDPDTLKTILKSGTVIAQADRPQIVLAGSIGVATSGKNGKSFSVYNVANKEYNNLVGAHWYALSNRESTTSTIAFRNPWGCNLNDAGKCISGSTGIVRFPIDLAALIFDVVHYTDG